MVEAFPNQIEAIYVNEVQPIAKTYKYDPETWKTKPVKPFFFKTYPEAALHAATRKPPLIRISGLRRICVDAINDFYMIQTKEWPSQKHKWDRHDDINQSLFYCNEFLLSSQVDPVPLLEAERLWKDGQKVKTPFGRGKIISFDPVCDSYEVELDWRPLNIQIAEYKKNELKEMQKTSNSTLPAIAKDVRPRTLETVLEADEEPNTASSHSNPEETGTEVQSTSNDSNSRHRSMECSEPTPLPPLEDESNGSCSMYKEHVVKAKIQCRYISKYSPPTLPSFPNDDESKSNFSFWGSRTDTKALFNKGDKCNTPYGCGTVIEYRENTGIVVIAMSGWSATCYLNAECVKIVSEGFFNRIISTIIYTDSKTPSQQKASPQKELQFPYAMDSIIYTPFGEGRVVRPLKRKDADIATTEKAVVHSKRRIEMDGSNEVETIAVSLSSWILADESHPVLYCTVDAALGWRGVGDEDTRSKNSGGILSAFGSIVSQSVKNLIVGKPERKPTEVPSVIVVPLFERFYEDGAAVVTPYGTGVVDTFREADGIYVVTLENWKLANHVCPKIYVRKDSLSYQISPGCIEGYPVLTSLGLTGILLSVQPKTGIHIVAVSMAGMVCYLQPKDVLRPLKAAVNDDVLTQWGNGKLVKYRARDDIYEIELIWGAKLFARAESFYRDRDNSGQEEREGFGISWVFRLFFSSENSVRGTGGSQRSRSNSVASVRTHTSRSLL